MYKAIYREYRPETFGEVLGQDYIVRVLQNQIKAGQLSHAYLFCGTRGTGKTTVARLLAKAVNCTGEGERPCGVCPQCRAIAEGTFMDLIEIDAASNNGVEDVRELRESVNYPPVAGRMKVYILDEVHMLSTPAFNALLKTLEEPPENVMFILCTTEPEKLPPTVLSRCMRMDFRRVSERDLVERMAKVCRDRGIEAEEGALALVATMADGSVRDGLSVLEQCISGRQGRITREDILEAIGAVGVEAYLDLTDTVIRGRVADGLVQIEDMMTMGKDARQIIQGWLGHYRNLLLVRYIENPENVLSMSRENIARLSLQSDSMELGDITGAMRELSRILYDARRSSQPRILLEMAMVKLASGDASEEIIKAVAPVRKAAAVAPAKGLPEDTVPLTGAPAAKQEPQTPAADPVVPAAQAQMRQALEDLASGEPPKETYPFPTFDPEEGEMTTIPGRGLEEEGPAPAGRPQAPAASAAPQAPDAHAGPMGALNTAPQEPYPDPYGEPVPAGYEPYPDPYAGPGPAGYDSPAPDLAPAYEQIPVPAPAPGPAPEPEPEPEDLERLWEAFLSNGEKTIGNMFFALRDSTEPVAIEGRTIKVAVTGGARAYLTDNMDRMTKLMSAVRGRDSRLELVGEKPAREPGPDPAADDETEELRALAASVLGVDVTLQ